MDIKSGKLFHGWGKVSTVFSEAEELKIVNLIQRTELGVGLDFKQLSLIIQELKQIKKKLNPDRYCPPTKPQSRANFCSEIC